MLGSTSMGQLPPGILGELHAEPPSGRLDAPPSVIAFVVADVLHLVEPGHGVPDMASVDKRLLPQSGESELLVAQLVFLCLRQSARHGIQPLPSGGVAQLVYSSS